MLKSDQLPCVGRSASTRIVNRLDTQLHSLRLGEQGGELCKARRRPCTSNTTVPSAHAAALQCPSRGTRRPREGLEPTRVSRRGVRHNMGEVFSLYDAAEVIGVLSEPSSSRGLLPRRPTTPVKRHAASACRCEVQVGPPISPCQKSTTRT